MPPLLAARLKLVLAATLWSTSGAFTKLLAAPPLAMAATRVLFAGAFLLLFLRRPVRYELPMVGMVACFALMNVTFITAMTVTTAASAIFLQYTAPLWMTLFSVYALKEPFDRKGVAPMALALLGIGVILSADSGKGYGVVLGLIAGIFYAGVAVFLRRLRHHDPIWLTFLNHTFAGLLLLPWAVPEWPALSLAQWAGLFSFGVLQMGIPYLLFSSSLRTLSAQEAGVITLLEPVLNPCLAFLAVGERPAPGVLWGGGLILLGVGVRYLPARK